MPASARRSIPSVLCVLSLVCAPPVLHAQAAAVRVDSAAFAHGVEQLRHVIGRWAVRTDMLNDDGSVARSLQGTYEFSWVVPDRVVSGRSDIPELAQSAGILFYVNAQRGKIEMVSVGADGQLWVMTGGVGAEARETQDFAIPGGGSGRLRFTRFNVERDSFESRMERTRDDGRTWQPGNHQWFTRVGPARG